MQLRGVIELPDPVVARCRRGWLVGESASSQGSAGGGVLPAVLSRDQQGHASEAASDAEGAPGLAQRCVSAAAQSRTSQAQVRGSRSRGRGRGAG